jgi:hypothetical protein
VAITDGDSDTTTDGFAALAASEISAKKSWVFPCRQARKLASVELAGRFRFVSCL